MFTVSKHVTLWMRQTGSEGRGEAAGKCLCIYKSLEYILVLNNLNVSKIIKY